jgi:hypothetical protein
LAAGPRETNWHQAAGWGVEEPKDGKIKEKVKGIRLRPVHKQLKIIVQEA